jgi:flagellar hook-length control protein FliK
MSSLLIADSVRPASTQQQQQQQQQQKQRGNVEGMVDDDVEVAVPAAQSDRVAEAALGEPVCVYVPA